MVFSVYVHLKRKLPNLNSPGAGKGFSSGVISGLVGAALNLLPGCNRRVMHYPVPGGVASALSVLCHLLLKTAVAGKKWRRK